MSTIRVDDREIVCAAVDGINQARTAELGHAQAWKKIPTHEHWLHVARNAMAEAREAALNLPTTEQIHNWEYALAVVQRALDRIDDAIILYNKTTTPPFFPPSPDAGNLAAARVGMALAQTQRAQEHVGAVLLPEGFKQVLPEIQEQIENKRPIAGHIMGTIIPFPQLIPAPAVRATVVSAVPEPRATVESELKFFAEEASGGKNGSESDGTKLLSGVGAPVPQLEKRADDSKEGHEGNARAVAAADHSTAGNVQPG